MNNHIAIPRSSKLSYYHYTTSRYDICGLDKPFKDMFIYLSINSR